MLPEDKRNQTDEIVKILHRIGMVYGIIAQERTLSLSLVQRTMSVLMLDSGVPLQVNLSVNMGDFIYWLFVLFKVVTC